MPAAPPAASPHSPAKRCPLHTLPPPAPYPSHPCPQAGRRFDVIVTDSRPLLEGRRMLAQLLEGGVTCEYCHLNALSYQITQVDKVRPLTLFR